MRGSINAAWRRYLLVGVLSAIGCAALPIGVGRDLVYCLIGASSGVAMIVGVRLLRPAHPLAWYLFAAGTGVWTLGDALFAWYQHVVMIEPFPSFADVLYLSAYPLFAAGLLLLVRSRGGARGPFALLDSAILTIALALLSWVFLIEPTWAAADSPMLTRLVGIAYPIFDVMIFAILMRLSTAAAEWNAAARLVAASVGVLIATDVLFAAAAFVPAIEDHASLLDPGWLLSYVLWGAAALHPSMRHLSASAHDRAEELASARVAALALAVMISPTLLALQVLGGATLTPLPILVATALTLPLAAVRTVLVLRRITAQAERLRLLADTDFVTGLANRRHLANTLAGFLDAPHRRSTGYLLIQLERFTEINDNLGHQTGDAILHAVGVRLGELSGEHALVARMAGDLLGVLDPAITSGEEAELAATRIRAALEKPLELTDLTVSIEVCVGALVLPEDGTDPRVVQLRADVALAVARTRPGRTARYGFEMENGSTLAPQLIGELRGAIEHGDLVVHFQPQVEVSTGHVFGVEALVRWQHPHHGLVGPDSFVAAAEHMGLIGPLTQFVLDEALAQCTRWRSRDLFLTIAVNLSVRNLLDHGLVQDVRSALDRHGLDAECLELEITEGTAMVDPRRSMEVLGAFAAMGITLSIDDYGTGHSSLAYLQRLPVRRLKIDRSFVTDMIDDDASTAIVRSTIELARVLRLDVVAEGVEDDATLLRLRDMNCFAAQGFGLGRPTAGPLIPELIRRIEARLPAVLATAALSSARPRDLTEAS